MRRATALVGILSVFAIAPGVGTPAQAAQDPPAADFVLSTMISRGLDLLAGRALPLLVSMAAIGVLTMALQQAVKDILRLHVGFNRRRVHEWVEGQGASAQGRDQLLSLALGGTSGATAPGRAADEALFELSLSALTSQLAAASKFALAFPEEHGLALRVGVGSLGTNEVATLVRATAAERERIAAGTPMTPEHQALLADADAGRTRLSFLIDRRMDAFQVDSTSRWEHQNKIAAFGISALLAALAITVYVVSYNYWTPLTKSQGTALVALIPLAALIAGFVAPVAKDLVTALQSVRSSR